MDANLPAPARKAVHQRHLQRAEDGAEEVSQIIVTLPKAAHEALKEQAVIQEEAEAQRIAVRLTARAPARFDT